MPRHSLASALSDLIAHGVDFLVVGGVAAVLQGAPIQTFDLDIVYAIEPPNIERLMAFLRQSDAFFRRQPERRLRPDESHLATGGRLNLLTRYGPLDVLGTIGNSLRYADVLPHSQQMEVANGVRVRVLDLETIIAVKEQLGTNKDRAVLPVLGETMRLKQQG